MIYKYKVITMNKILQFLILILVICFVLLCIHIFYKKEGFQDENEEPTKTRIDISSLDDYMFTGIAIKNPGNQRYLTKNDNGTLVFTESKLISYSESGTNKVLDPSKFTLIASGSHTDGYTTYKIKTHGKVLGSNEEATFLRVYSDLNGPGPFGNVKADATQSNATSFIIRPDTTSIPYNQYQLYYKTGDSITLEDAQQETFQDTITNYTLLMSILIEHYLPEGLSTPNYSYLNTTEYEDQLNNYVGKCNDETDENKIYDLTVNDITECAEKCDIVGNCNHFAFTFFGNQKQSNNCKLYKDCTQDTSYFTDNFHIDTDDKENDRTYIMKKSIASSLVDRQEMSVNENREIRSKLKDYNSSIGLIKENKSLIQEINDKIQQIKSMPQIDTTSENNNAYQHVMEHNKIMNEINNKENLTDMKFNISQYVQDSKINNLEQELANIERMKQIQSVYNIDYNDTNEIKSISNYDNTKSMNVYLPEDIDPKREELHEYMVFGNGKCLEFKKQPDGTKMVNEYKFVDCNRNDDTQLFKIDKIRDIKNFNDKVDNPFYKIKSSENDVFGFHTLSPKLHTTQCITLNDDGLTIQPCNLQVEQRFNVSNNISSC